MKKFITSLFIFVSCLLNAQVPEWEWARSGGGLDEYARVTGISTDANGNSYITGYFFSDTLTLGNYILTNEGYINVNLFIAKYDSTGNVLWAKSAGGNPNAYSLAISPDTNGNCLITGGFSSAIITFGNDSLKNSDTPNYQIFIAKYDSAGNSLWANIGGIDSGTSLSTDPQGNIFLIGNGTLIKYYPSGNIAWKRQGGSYVSTDVKGNCYITGNFTGPFVLGNDTIGANTFGGEFLTFGVYIAKYDSSGNINWVSTTWLLNQYEDYLGTSSVSGISNDANGNTYIIGGENTPPTNNNSPPFSSVLMTKFDSAGNELWTNSMTGCLGSSGARISTDTGGNSYIAGYYVPSDTVYLGNYNLGDSYISSYDFFIAKCNSADSIIWAKGVKTNMSIGEGSDAAVVSGISFDANDNSYICGYFQDTTLTFSNYTLSEGPSNIFIAKLSSQLYTGIPILSSPISPITVFPNPSTGQFYFKGVMEGSTITISNMLGQTIYSSPVNGDNYMINLGYTAKGIYIYNVKNKSEEVQQGKLVIE